MQILDGKLVATHYEGLIKNKVEDFRKRHGRAPGLAVILVGEDPASQIYVRNKEQACERAGIASFRHNLPKGTTERSVLEMLEKLNNDERIDGVLVQSPVPQPLKFESILNKLNPLKDADGLTTTNLGLLWAGKPQIVPCTPKGVMKLLEYYKVPVKGRRAVVVGRSSIVGKPMAELLNQADATVTICHSKTVDLRSYTREADIVVVAAGKPRMLGREDFKKGVVVVDVGIHRDENNKVCGDVRFEELQDVASYATPVPKGVGPMTITMLLQNTLELAELHVGERG